MGESTYPLTDLLEHRAWVRAVARSLVANEHDVDDVEQETWLAALRWPVPRSAAPRRWLATVLRRTIARRRTADHRRSAREQAAARRGLDLDGADPVARAEAHERVVQVLLRLPEPYRTTLLLRFFEDLPPREIARRMQAKVETVRARVRRGLARLHADLGKGWAAVLAPLLPPRGAAAAAVGGALMSSKMTQAGAALMVLLLAWWALQGGGRRGQPRTVRHGTVQSATGGRGPAAAAGAVDGASRPKSPDGGAAPLKGGDVAKSQTGKAQATNERSVPGQLTFEGGWLPPRPVGTATLTGTVTDRDGRPLPGAVIHRLKQGCDHSTGTLHRFRDMFKVGVADKQGRFQLREQRAGRFLLAADFEDLVVVWGKGRDTKGAAFVEIVDGETRANIEIRLPFALSDMASLGGLVVDDLGARVPLARVEMGVFFAVTDAGGRFRLRYVPQGVYKLLVSKCGHRDQAMTLELAQTKGRDEKITLPLLHAGPHRIRGRVLDTGGRPVPGIDTWLNLHVEESGRESIRHVRTDGEGRYAFRRLSGALTGRVDVQVPAQGTPRWVGQRREAVAVPADHLEFVLGRALRLTLRFVSASAGRIPG